MRSNFNWNVVRFVIRNADEDSHNCVLSVAVPEAERIVYNLRN
jgi:hypothetical protein